MMMQENKRTCCCNHDTALQWTTSSKATSWHDEINTIVHMYGYFQHKCIYLAQSKMKEVSQAQMLYAIEKLHENEHKRNIVLLQCLKWCCITMIYSTCFYIRQLQALFKSLFKVLFTFPSWYLHIMNLKLVSCHMNFTMHFAFHCQGMWFIKTWTVHTHTQANMNLTSHVASFQKACACNVVSFMSLVNISTHSACIDIQYDQLCIHSQLITKSKLDEVPLLTDMLKFIRFNPTFHIFISHGNDMWSLTASLQS